MAADTSTPEGGNHKPIVLAGRLAEVSLFQKTEQSDIQNYRNVNVTKARTIKSVTESPKATAPQKASTRPRKTLQRTAARRNVD